MIPWETLVQDSMWSSQETAGNGRGRWCTRNQVWSHTQSPQPTTRPLQTHNNNNIIRETGPPKQTQRHAQYSTTEHMGCARTTKRNCGWDGGSPQANAAATHIHSIRVYPRHVIVGEQADVARAVGVVHRDNASDCDVLTRLRSCDQQHANSMHTTDE